MLVNFQIPFTDVRHFVETETNRVKNPAWPTVKPEVDFIRSFGGVRERKRGGIKDWPGEENYCDAAKAIRFPPEPATGTPRHRCVFRRFWADPWALARLEIGLRVREPTWFSMQTDLAKMVTYVLRTPLKIPDDGGQRIDAEMFEIARPLATRYLRATTKFKEKKLLPAEPWWVQAGQPLTIVEHDLRSEKSLPEFVQIIHDWPAEQIQLGYLRIELEHRRFGVWVLGYHPDESDADLLRRMRLHLSRLHTEREGLKQTLRLIAQERLAVPAAPEVLGRLQAFFDNAFDLLAKTSCYGLPQSDVLLAAQNFEDLVSEGERQTLLSVLAPMRRSLREKLAGITAASRALAGQLVQIIGDHNVVSVEQNGTKTMNNQSINFGQGNTFQGDVNLNQTVAKTIQDSFNRVSNSDGSPDLKKSLTELSRQVAELCKQLPEPDQKKAAQDLETLTNEALSETPRKKWYELSSEGLLDAAKTVASMAAPVTAAVNAVLALLVV